MKTNPTSFRIDYVSPEIKMIALNGGTILTGSNQLLQLQSSSIEELDEEVTYKY